MFWECLTFFLEGFDISCSQKWNSIIAWGASMTWKLQRSPSGTTWRMDTLTTNELWESMMFISHEICLNETISVRIKVLFLRCLKFSERNHNSWCCAVPGEQLHHQGHGVGLGDTRHKLGYLFRQLWLLVKRWDNVYEGFKYASLCSNDSESCAVPGVDGLLLIGITKLCPGMKTFRNLFHFTWPCTETCRKTSGPRAELESVAQGCCPATDSSEPPVSKLCGRSTSSLSLSYWRPLHTGL